MTRLHPLRGKDGRRPTITRAARQCHGFCATVQANFTDFP
jgi:hypothetical protein